MEFTTVPDVEIVATGTYRLDSGETTFTAEDLKGAVLAASDSTVITPRIGIGHSDPRFADYDGEPAFGVAKNLRLSEDQQRIIADFEKVPKWLAESMPSHFPNRSIEGGFDFTAPSGRTYPLVVSKVKLLGQTWPGITSLKDLEEVMSENGPVLPEPVAAGGEYVFMGGNGTAKRFVCAKLGEPVRAAIDLGALPRRFFADLKAGRVPRFGESDQGKWWARNVQAADDGRLEIVVDTEAGEILRLPFTVNGDGLDYGAPSALAPVTAKIEPDDFKGPRVLASWPKPAAGPTSTEAKIMDVDRGVLIKRLGLADDATDDAITAALGAPAAPVAASSGLPEGVVAIDAATLDALQRGAKAGEAVAATLAERERDEAIKAALEEGKFPVGRREHYERSWNADPDGTRQIIASLAPGLVPAAGRETGRSGDGEGDPADEDRIVAEFERHLFPELAMTTGEGA